MDMPDTVTAAEASHSGFLDGDYDDAAGYYTPGAPLVDSKAPDGPISERWQNRKFEARLVNPARPVPTMMTDSLRRLDGLTRRASNLRFCQRSAIGPSGALLSTSGSPGV